MSASPRPIARLCCSKAATSSIQPTGSTAWPMYESATGGSLRLVLSYHWQMEKPSSTWRATTSRRASSTCTPRLRHPPPLHPVARPHVNTFSSGVTTVVDAGTAGWRDFADFKDEVIDRADQGAGLRQHRRLRHGRRVGARRAGDASGAGRGHGPGASATWWSASRPRTTGPKPLRRRAPPWAAVDAAVEAGELCGLPVMVDFYPSAAGAALPRPDPGEAAARRHPHPRLRPAVPRDRRGARSATTSGGRASAASSSIWDTARPASGSATP